MARDPVTRALAGMLAGLKKSIIDPILGPILKIIKMVKGLGKIFMNLLKPIIALVNKIISTMKNAFIMVKNAFTSIFEKIRCGIERLKNAPKCAIYYLIDTIFFTLLIPVRILIVIFPVLQEFESTFRETVDKLDGMVHTISLQTIGKGLHINKWPDSVLNKCYRCKPIIDSSGKSSGNIFSQLISNNDLSNNFFGFFLKSLIILSAMGGCVYGIRSALSTKKCANPL